MSFIDDRCVVVACGACGIGALHELGVDLDERIALGLVYQRVVRCDTRLTTSEKLAVDNLGCRMVQRLTFGNDDRGLAAELQRHGDKIVARGLHHGAPDRRAACEDEVVKRQGGERRADSRITIHDRDLLFA